MRISSYFKIRLAIFGIFTTSLSLAFWGCQQSDSATRTIEVMSFNIRYGTAKDGDNHWEKRKELVFDVFRDHQPDVVGLQEALRFQIDEILGALPRYAFVGTGRNPDGEGEYSAILYDKKRFKLLENETFWLSDTPEVASASWGNKLVRICTVARLEESSSGYTFYVFNTHFDHQSEDSRTQSALLVAERIANRAHKADAYIVMGDFNAGEDTQAIRSLLGKAEPAPHFENAPLVDSFRTIHPVANPVGTFGRWTGFKEGAKIDHVFVAPEIEVLDAAIIHDNQDGRYPSDHYPVKATIRLQ